MLTLGRRTDYEDKIICDYVKLMKILEFEHPEDAALKAHKRKCLLIALQRLTQEREIPIFMKNSLRELMGDDFKQEYPWEVNTHE